MEKKEQTSAELNLVELLARVVRYFGEYWRWHLLFAAVALSGGFAYAKLRNYYSAEGLLLQTGNWLSRNEMQHILDGYPLPHDALGDSIRSQVISVMILPTRGNESQSEKEFSITISSRVPLDQRHIKQSIDEYLKDQPYLQNIRALRKQELDIRIRYLDSIALSTNNALREVAELKQGERVLLDLRNERVDYSLYSAKSDLLVSRMYLDVSMHNLVSVRMFESKFLRLFTLSATGIFFGLGIFWALLKAIQFLLKR